MSREAVTHTRMVTVVSQSVSGSSDGTWCSWPPQQLLNCRLYGDLWDDCPSSSVPPTDRLWPLFISKKGLLLVSLVTFLSKRERSKKGESKREKGRSCAFKATGLPDHASLCQALSYAAPAPSHPPGWLRP